MRCSIAPENTACLRNGNSAFPLRNLELNLPLVVTNTHSEEAGLVLN